MSGIWVERRKTTVYKNKILQVEESIRRGPEGQEGMITLIRCPDWVNVAALTTDPSGRPALVLVRQYRHGGELFSLEFPGGVVEPGEDPAVAAARELREETGFDCDSLQLLGSINPNPSFMTNRTYSYVATGLRPVGAQNLDELESIEVHTCALEDLSRGVYDEFERNGIMMTTWFWLERWLAVQKK